MVEVTESDKSCIPAHILGAIPKVWHKAIHTAVATHREAAANAERDRIVAWLRDDASLTEIEARRVLGNLIVLTAAETEAWAKLVAMKHGIADALEKRHG